MEENFTVQSSVIFSLIHWSWLTRQDPESRENDHKNISLYYKLPCEKCDVDFLMSFWRQFGLVREWDQIHTGNPIIFLANAVEIPWLELLLCKIHVMFQHGEQIESG